MMRRRNYLALAGAILGAGCTSGEEREMEGGKTRTDDGGDEGGGGEEETPADDQEDNEAEDTETPTPEGAAVEIVDSELVIDDSGYSVEARVDATVENTGGVASGPIELQVDWYDENGDYLDDSTAYLQTLPADETWLARVEHLGSGGEEVADYELRGSFETEPPREPDGVELLESEVVVGDNEAKVRGRVENQRDEALDYVEAIGTLYDADGNVLGDDYTNESDLPAGETWRFEMSWLDDRLDAIDDHTVTLDATAF